MIGRVAWIVGGLVALATAGWGITIPLTGFRSTGFTSSGTLITTDAGVDGNWTFYAGSDLSALSGISIPAYVVRTTGKPFQPPADWTANTTTSQWISPTSARRGGGNHLARYTGASYLAVTTFSIPAMTDPPNWTQWWLVMEAQVWADDGVNGNTFYLLDSSNTQVYTGSLIGTAGPLSAATLSFATWVNPEETYKLAFIIKNSANTISGFRFDVVSANLTPEVVSAYMTPEPGSWTLMLSAGAGLVFAGWRRRRAKKPQT